MAKLTQERWRILSLSQAPNLCLPCQELSYVARICGGGLSILHKRINQLPLGINFLYKRRLLYIHRIAATQEMIKILRNISLSLASDLLQCFHLMVRCENRKLSPGLSPVFKPSINGPRTSWLGWGHCRSYFPTGSEK